MTPVLKSVLVVIMVAAFVAEPVLSGTHLVKITVMVRDLSSTIYKKRPGIARI